MQGGDIVSVTFQGTNNNGACLGIPDPDRLIFRARQDPLSIRGQCKGGDIVSVTFQGANNNGACLGIPDPDVLSSEPDRMRLPSGEHATEVT